MSLAFMFFFACLRLCNRLFNTYDYKRTRSPPKLKHRGREDEEEEDEEEAAEQVSERSRIDMSSSSSVSAAF